MKSDTTPKPTRPLSKNFTDSTLERAINAKRRTLRRSGIRRLFKVKKTHLLKQPIGALIALAIVAAGGVGVYAATNWFNGNVEVTSTDDSIITVDLSECKSAVPPGVEPSQPLDKVKFKVLGTPHISSSELKRHLLAHCEFANVLEVQRVATGHDAAVTPALVKRADPQKGSITLAFTWGPWSHEATYVLATQAKVLDKGVPATLEAFKPGDFVVFTYRFSGPILENIDPYASLTAIDGLFKTQYDTRLVQEKTLYESGNIMPLDQYNKVHH